MTKHFLKNQEQGEDGHFPTSTQYSIRRSNRSTQARERNEHSSREEKLLKPRASADIICQVQEFTKIKQDQNMNSDSWQGAQSPHRTVSILKRTLPI